MTSSEPINIHDAKNHLSKLCELAASGQEVLLARYGQPWVRLTALEPAKRVIRYGLLAGDVVISEDFDARYDEDASNVSERQESKASVSSEQDLPDEDEAIGGKHVLSEAQPPSEDGDVSPSIYGDP